MLSAIFQSPPLSVSALFHSLCVSCLSVSLCVCLSVSLYLIPLPLTPLPLTSICHYSTRDGGVRPPLCPLHLYATVLDRGDPLT